MVARVLMNTFEIGAVVIQMFVPMCSSLTKG
jgi:hypothetical protein